MIQLTPQHRLLVCIKAVDFRKGIDGLVGICRSQLNADPFTGTLFAFINRKRTAVKLLVYDGTGFWLMHKRFSKGKLKHWPTDHSQPVCATTMIILLNQGEPATLSSAWRALPSSSAAKVA